MRLPRLHVGDTLERGNLEMTVAAVRPSRFEGQQVQFADWHGKAAHWFEVKDLTRNKWQATKRMTEDAT